MSKYLIELQSLPSAVPSEIRLRRAIKQLLRTFNLRCTSVRQQDEPQKPVSPLSVAATGGAAPSEGSHG